MSEYLIQKETLDDIATQSNELVGKTVAVSPATIISDLTNANTAVDTQADLIAQIASVLEGKAGGSGGGHNDILINSMKTIGSYAFAYCSSLTSANFPACTEIGINAFFHCSNLTSVSFPVCTSIGNSAFNDCRNLTSASFPACTNISNWAFANCSNLTSVNFPACTSIGSYAFYSCYMLSSLTLGASTVCTLSDSNAFLSTPYAGYSTYFSGTPHIYVPASLLTSYQAATNWTYFSSYFVGDASLDKEDGGSVELITFVIDGTTYQAEEGMTWADWVDSEYNTDGYVTGMFSNVLNNTGMRVCYTSGLGVGHEVNRDESIIDDCSYVSS